MPPTTELSNRARTAEATKSTTPIQSLFQSSRLYRFAAARSSAKDHPPPTGLVRQDSNVPKSLKVFKGQAKDIVQGIFLFLMLRFLLVALVCLGLLVALGLVFVLQARSKAALDPSISFWAALW